MDTEGLLEKGDREPTIVKALRALSALLDELGPFFEKPRLLNYKGIPVQRHVNRDDRLLCYLKCVRCISTLNASVVLLKAGYVQEAYALCRIADEVETDVFFMAMPHDDGKPSVDQKRLFDEFFQEELERPDDATSSLPRDRVSREKIHAAVSRYPVRDMNPHDFGMILNSIHKVMSGFVHGAYVHIMEMYGGSPAKFHVCGVNELPHRLIECESQLANNVYRGILAVRAVAIRVEAKAIDAALKALATSFAEETGCVSGDIKATMKRIKDRQKAADQN